MKECQEQVCSTSEPEPRLRTQSKRVLTRDQVKYVTFGLFEGNFTPGRLQRASKFVYPPFKCIIQERDPVLIEC